MKRFISAILSVIMTLTVFSAVPYAANCDFFNADCESDGNGVFYYIDEGSVFRETADGDYGVFLKTDAEKIGVSGDVMYILKGNAVTVYDIKKQCEKTLFESGSQIKRFSKSGNTIFYLTGGEIITYDILAGKSERFIYGKTINDFWLDDCYTLSYMTDEDYIHSLNLITGETTQKFNFASKLSDSLLVSDGSGLAKGQNMSLIKLQDKFPDGKYWNHGSGRNDPDGYTSTPCGHHPSDSGCSYDGSCGCNSFGSAIQCMGYAHKCGYDVTGNNPSSGSGGWSKSTSSSSVNNVKAGDVIRYRDNGHSIYVTGVSGDTITFTDCNWGHNCRIRWEAEISKSTVKSSFSYLYSAPFDAGIYKIELDACGGECDKKSVTVASGEAFGTLPVPQKEGYDFKGWFTSSSGGSEVTASTVFDTDFGKKLYAHWEIKIYTITYNINGGEGDIPSQTKKHGDSLVLTSKHPSRRGYDFEGWNTKADGSGTEYRSSAIFKENTSLTLYAHWTPKQFRVSFDANGGRASSMGMTVTFGSPYGDLPEATKDGYDFTGWHTERDGGQLITNSTPVDIEKFHTLYAHWEEAKYYIYFQGKKDGTWPQTQYKLHFSDTHITLTVPTATGYTFKSWNTDENGYGREYMPGDLYTTNETVYLYAQWERNKYTVNYSSNGGSGAPSAQTKEYDLTLKLSSTVPVRTGYTFVEWNTNMNGNGSSYKPSGSYNSNSSATLYAIWKANEYKLTFDVMGGACDPKTKTVTYDKQFGSLPAAYRTGYIFKGWYTPGGNKINESDTVLLTEDTVLHAEWETVKYPVTFISGGGSAPDNQFKLHGTDLKLSEVIPEKYGFEFVSWNSSPDGTGTSFEAGSIYEKDEAVTLYAIWKTAKYTVSYDANGGINAPEAQAKTHGRGLLLTTEAPRKQGFDFSGWNTNADGSGISYDGGDAFSYNGNTVLFAQWTAKKYEITFSDGKGSDKKEIKHGEKFGELPVPSADGCVFTGWFDENGKEIYPDSKFLYLSDITVYARYISENEFNDGENAYAVFVDGGNIVKKEIYSGDISALNAPGLSGGDGYYAKWGDCVSQNGGVLIRAEYTPLSYTAKFTADGKTVALIEYSSEDTEIPEPPVPQKDGYTAEWGEYVPGGNIEITASYTPIVYRAVFIADGKTVKTVEYTVENKNITAPAVPEKSGYSGEWENYTLSGNTKIHAVYSLREYEAVYYAQGIEVGRRSYRIDTAAVNEPDIPEKPGYSGRWESYDFTAGGVSVNAVYTPNDYTVTFRADGNYVAEVTYTYGAAEIELPEVPQKPGYTGRWGSYSLGYSNSTVNAIYTPIVYTATFVAAGVVIGTAEFTVESRKIDEPVPPEIEGQQARWAEYEIVPENITVEAIYEIIRKVSIRGFAPEVYYDYKTTVTFTADAAGLTDGYELHWFVDGEDRGTGNSDCTFSVEKPKFAYTIQAKIIKDGEVIAETETESVIIRRTILRRIIYLFRLIFKLSLTAKQL